jgi:hypothetical protein
LNRRKGRDNRRKARREKAAAEGARTLQAMAKVAGQRTQVRVIRRRGYVTQVVLWLGDQTIAWRPHSGIGPI